MQLPIPSGASRLLIRVSTLLLVCSLTACQSLPSASMQQPAGWQARQQALGYVDNWSLRGRLNVRQDDQNDTVTINWAQTGENFDIRLSGSLGLGAVAVHGNNKGLVVEKNGEQPLTLANLDALSQEYLDFEFPASHLKFWVRGLAVPELAMAATWNEQAQLNTLTQTDASGQRWQLSYDRYQQHAEFELPGRIRLERGNIRLTFLINDWQMSPPLLARL